MRVITTTADTTDTTTDTITDTMTGITDITIVSTIIMDTIGITNLSESNPYRSCTIRRSSMAITEATG